MPEPLAPPLTSIPGGKEAWVMFAGDINTQAAQRIFNMLSLASQSNVSHIHMMFQSGGGSIGDGVAIYNALHTSPVKVSAYNIGTVASVAVVAFLGARERHASQFAAFMIHRSYCNPIQITSERAQAIAQSLIIDDNRVEAILRMETTLSDEDWKTHSSSDLWLGAEDAVNAGIVNSLKEFAPPLGSIPVTV